MSNINAKLSKLRTMAKPEVYTHASFDDDRKSFSAKKFKEPLSKHLVEKLRLIVEGFPTAGNVNGNLTWANARTQIATKLETGVALDANEMSALAQSEGRTPFGPVYLEEADIKAIKAFQGRLQDADFDRWFATKYYQAAPMEKAYAKELHPEYFETRLDDFRGKLEFIFKVKKIQLLGPQNEDDLILQWALEEGKISLPDGWDQVGIPASGPPAGLAAGFNNASAMTGIRRGAQNFNRFFNYRTNARPVGQLSSDPALTVLTAAQSTAANAAQGFPDASGNILGGAIYSGF